MAWRADTLQINVVYNGLTGRYPSNNAMAWRVSDGEMNPSSANAAILEDSVGN